MKIKAYKSFYLYDVQKRFACILDYLFYCFSMDDKEIQNIITKSNHIKWLFIGHPYYAGGHSGIEICHLIEEEFNLERKREYVITDKCTPYYWAGYYLAYYSWFECKSLQYIFYSVSLERVLKMYPVYHEMDIMHFVDDFDSIVSKGIKETNLKLIRMINNYSQSQLAKKSGVSLRSIQLYEQRVNDINKAQACALLKLAKTLNRNIEELMENNN